jgi:hypothetical protein
MKSRLEIDILKLYSEHNSSQWNAYLTKCLKLEDWQDLVRTRKGLQLGMDSLVKKRLNTDSVCELFARLDASIRKTLRRVYMKQNPLKNDNPLLASQDHHLLQKRKRDQDFEVWYQKVAW